MKKIMLIGTTNSGKTTLMQALEGHKLKYKKTQAMDYHGAILDTPGEFIENRRFYSALMTASVDYQVVGVLHDATTRQNLIPPGFASMFNREVIGIITKIDSPGADPEFSRKALQQAGIKTIFAIDSCTGKGLAALKAWLDT